MIANKISKSNIYVILFPRIYNYWNLIPLQNWSFASSDMWAIVFTSPISWPSACHSSWRKTIMSSIQRLFEMLLGPTSFIESTNEQSMILQTRFESALCTCRVLNLPPIGIGRHRAKRSNPYYLLFNLYII